MEKKIWEMKETREAFTKIFGNLLNNSWEYPKRFQWMFKKILEIFSCGKALANFSLFIYFFIHYHLFLFIYYRLNSIFVRNHVVYSIIVPRIMSRKEFKEMRKIDCVKSVQIRSFFLSVFSRIRTEYGEIQSISPYSIQMRENTDQKKLRIWTLFTQWLLLCYIINQNLLFCLAPSQLTPILK